MDPLSVSAHIRGLLAASLDVANLFAAVMTTYDYARTVHDEIYHFRVLLFQLEKCLHSDSVDVGRSSMIDSEEVAVVITGCTYTLSEFEREIKRINSRSEGLRRVWWMMAKPRLVDLVERLKSNQGTISSMLPILTSRSQDNLGSITALPSGDNVSDGITSTDLATTLLSSRIYRRTRCNSTSSFLSFDTGFPRESNWSVLSGLSQISNHAAHELPISPGETYNQTFYRRPPSVLSFESIPEDHALITKGFAEELQLALTHKDMETAKTIASSITWEMALEMSAVYPTLPPGPLNSTGEVLDNLSLFKLWLRCGGNSEAMNQHGQTAIKKALEVEDWRLFKLLAQNGADINFTGDSKTVLHHVLGEGGEAFVLGLCEDIEKENRAEIAPIGFDLERKREQAVEVLLELGADINAADGWGKTALHWFSEGGHKGVVEVLLSYGADIHAKDMWETTSLHWASESGHRVVAEVLLSHGADVNVKDRWGMTAIYYASEGGHRDVIEVLLGHGADIGSRDRWEKTTLHCASWCGDKGLVEVLLSHGANIHATDMWGTTSLHWASEAGHKGVVKILLRHGGDINAKDRWGMTALHHASKGGHKGVVKILLRRGADINAKDRSEDTALHLALESGHNGVIELLSSRGADISGKDE